MLALLASDSQRPVEALAAFDFPEPELDNLRSSILEVADTGPGLDAQTPRQHLALCGHAEALGALAIVPWRLRQSGTPALRRAEETTLT